MTKRLAEWMRRIADRIDYAGAPKCTGWSFTFEPGKGVQFNQDGNGCPLWYLGDLEYYRAHSEGGRTIMTSGLPRLPAR